MMQIPNNPELISDLGTLPQPPEEGIKFQSVSQLYSSYDLCVTAWEDWQQIFTGIRADRLLSEVGKIQRAAARANELYVGVSGTVVPVFERQAANLAQLETRLRDSGKAEETTTANTTLLYI